MLSRFSSVQLFAILWTIACQAPLSTGFSSKDIGVGCHALLQGNLPDPRMEPMSFMSPALVGGLFTTSATRKAPLQQNLSADRVLNPVIFPEECCLTSKISDFRNISYVCQTICRLCFKERKFPNSFQKHMLT